MFLWSFQKQSVFHFSDFFDQIIYIGIFEGLSRIKLDIAVESPPHIFHSVPHIGNVFCQFKRFFFSGDSVAVTCSVPDIVGIIISLGFFFQFFQCIIDFFSRNHRSATALFTLQHFKTITQGGSHILVIRCFSLRIVRVIYIEIRIPVKLCVSKSGFKLLQFGYKTLDSDFVGINTIQNILKSFVPLRHHVGRLRLEHFTFMNTEHSASNIFFSLCNCLYDFQIKKF